MVHNGPTGARDLSSSIPPATDPNAAAPSDRLWLRSELMGTQVITRDTGRRLGVVGEVVVDIDRREVVALGLRDNPLTRFLPGLPRWMPLEGIRQVGDVILVDTADSLAEGFNPERYSKVINCQVVTESGAQLGRVLGFSFDIETGELTTLVIGALGVPLLGEGVLSTWELAVGEIVSSGTDRIIVYEGAEEKLKQLGTGLLEKLGIGGASWEQEERERFRSGVVPAENQLPAGQPSATEQRRIQPATSRAVVSENELDYIELEERRERQPLRQRRYLDDDLDGPDPSRLEPERDDFSRGDFRGGDFSRGGDVRSGDFAPNDVERPDRAGRERERRELERDDRPELDRFERQRRDLEWPDRDREDVGRRESEPLPRMGRRDEDPAERLEPPRWREQPSVSERLESRPEDGSSGRDLDFNEDRQRQDSGSRNRSAPPEREQWSQDRRPLAAERPLPGGSGAEMPADEDSFPPARRPLAAEPRGFRGSSDTDPIDVEPEVLDDPW